MIETKFLDVLACPACKSSLIINTDSENLACSSCQKQYDVINGIPVLSVDEIYLPPMKKNDKNEDMFSSSTVYHLSELEIALDPSHENHIMPEFKPEHKVILDIGCGVGQTYVAAKLNDNVELNLIGLDIDFIPMNYGKNQYENINFINAYGDNLPIQSNSVDFLISRVSLLYTNIPVAFQEIDRILKPGGEIWITLNPAKKQMHTLTKAIKRFSIKGTIARSLVMLNGLFFHIFGKVIRMPFTSSYESFQSERAMRRLLTKNGFIDIKITHNNHFLITARKKPE